MAIFGLFLAYFGLYMAYIGSILGLYMGGSYIWLWGGVLWVLYGAVEQWFVIDHGGAVILRPRRQFAPMQARN